MPVVRYGHHIDLEFNELRNARIQLVSGLPTPLPERSGWLVYNVIDSRLYVCTGSGWELRATSADNLNGQLPAYYLDRANHTGQQPVSSISGFAAGVATVSISDMALPLAPLDMDGFPIVNVGNAVNDTDVPSWGQVIDFVNNQDFRLARLASTGNIALGSTGNGSIVDGEPIVTGDVILVRNQTAPAENGLYVVQALNMVRADNANTEAEMPPGLVVVVQEGDQADLMFMLTSPPGYVLGVDPVIFSPYGQAPTPLTAGDGISIVANVVSAVAATGITVGPSGIGVDFSVVSRYFVVDLAEPGSGTATTFVHGLGRAPVPVTVMEVATREEIMTGVSWPDDNSVTVDLSVAAVAGQYRVAVG